MGRVVHFEIPTADPEKAIEFYKNVFDWKIEKYEGMDYWLATTGEDNGMGINGAIIERANSGVLEQAEPVIDAAHAINAVITIGVGNIDETVEKIVENGGKVAMEKWPVQKIGWMVYFHDLDNNVLGVMQPDEKAGV